MQRSELEARARAIRWYHPVDLGQGVVARPERDMHNIWDPIQVFLRRFDFSGRKVLDVGCWDGYWTFLVEKPGAASVYAVDDVTQRWGGPEGFRLAHEALGSRARYAPDANVYRIDELDEREFDVVLFIGVIYHLLHPMLALAKLRAMVREGGTIFVEGAGLLDTRRSYTEFYNTDRFHGDGTNWFVPTVRCMAEMMRAAYLEPEEVAMTVPGRSDNPVFVPVEEVLQPTAPDGLPRRAVRSLLRRAGVDLRRAPAGQYGRILVRARAVTREGAHSVPDPLLRVFDTRFNR